MDPQDHSDQPPVVVTDTGHARARDRATAMTGYRGPAGAMPGAAYVSGTGDATASEGSIANTGYLVINQLSAELAPEQVECPPNLIRLPTRPTLFVGRRRELDLIDDALTTSDGVVIQAIHGLGGIGKSTLALQWAATRREKHNPVWWITADNPTAIDAGLAALATALHPALAVALPQDALREWALRWLNSHNGWLLVLDNVADPALIRPLLASATTGRFLITSRRATGWHGIAPHIALDVFSLAEAVELFIKFRPQDRPSEVEILCAELGCLPLAIEQIAAFCAETGVSAREYLDLLAHYPADMYATAAEGGDAARTIARIWHVTLDRLADDPLTGEILRTLAWYAPDRIPRAFLTSLAEPPALLHATGRLAAHSMITLDDRGDISVHRLVQAVARTPDPHDPHRDPDQISTARANATSALARALPADTDPEHWPAWRALLSHANALIEHTPPHADTNDTVVVCSQFVHFTLGQGQAKSATVLARRALDSCIRILGEAHPTTLVARNNLAAAYASSGHYRRAIPLFEQDLANSNRVLGPDHPEALRMRSSLAGAYGAVGDYGHAIPLYEQTVSDRVRVLGKNHPDTLVASHYLANCYQRSGDYRRAVQMHEQTLANRRRVLGNDHPDTLQSQSALAGAYIHVGDVEPALSLFKQNLADCVRVLGQDHPETMVSRNGLGRAYELLGDLDRAISLYEQNLVERTRALGDDHPEVWASRNNLALAYTDTGQLEQAIPMFEKAVEVESRVLGENNPDTMVTRHNLGNAYAQAGDDEQALPMYEQLLADRTRVLGQDHPDTIQVRSDIGKVYVKRRDFARAIPLYEQVLADRIRILGQDHPNTVKIHINLANAYVGAGQLGRGASLLEQLYDRAAQALDDNHAGSREMKALIAKLKRAAKRRR